MCIDWEEVRRRLLGCWNVLGLDLDVGCMNVDTCKILLSYMLIRAVRLTKFMLDLREARKKQAQMLSLMSFL